LTVRFWLLYSTRSAAFKDFSLILSLVVLNHFSPESGYLATMPKSSSSKSKAKAQPWDIPDFDIPETIGVWEDLYYETF
jgi:hypothetical protein